MTCRLSQAQERASLLAAEGKSNRQIAIALGLHVQTVKNYLCKAMKRVGARNRIELAMKVRRLKGNGNGDVTPSETAEEQAQ